jgi:hypothetical protein
MQAIYEFVEALVLYGMVTARLRSPRQAKAASCYILSAARSSLEVMHMYKDKIHTLCTM